MSFKNKIRSTSKSIRTIWSGSSRDLPRKQGTTWFYPLNFIDALNSDCTDPLKNFLAVPELNIIISKKAQFFANMQLLFVNEAGKEPPSNNDRIAKLLRNPNWFQSQKEFLQQTKMWREIFGREFLYFQKPTSLGYKNLFTIPSNLVEIKINNNTPFWQMMEMPDSLEYIYKWENKTGNLDKDSVLFINNPKSNIDAKNYLDGESPMAGIESNIKNLIAVYEARYTVQARKGATHILSPAQDAVGGINLSPEDKEELQSEWMKYGVGSNQFPFLFSSKSIDVNSIIMDVDKMKLFEETKEDTLRLCDKFKFNYELLSSEKGASLNNSGGQMNEVKKQQYEDVIIPEAAEWVENINEFLKLNGKSYKVVASYAHLFGFDIERNAKILQQLSIAQDKLKTTGLLDDVEIRNELLKYGIATGK